MKPVTLSGSQLVAYELKSVHVEHLGTLAPSVQAPPRQPNAQCCGMGAADNFAANLQKLVALHGGSVNGAATSWKVPTKTLESVLKAQRIPTLDTAERLASAAGYRLWQLLDGDFDPSNPPVLRAVTAKEAALYERLKALARELPDAK